MSIWCLFQTIKQTVTYHLPTVVKIFADRKPPGVGRGRGRGMDDGGARGRGRGAPMAKMSGNRGSKAVCHKIFD